MDKIYVPDEYYVGFKQESQDTLLAFLTPEGTDAAAKKRKQTVDGWAIVTQYNTTTKHYETIDSIPSKVLKNELLDGYKIADSVKRVYWGGGNVVWRILDPRGFEFEISSANFAKIIECTTITNGVINAKCILGRNGANNVLLPESSEPYVNALSTTKAKNSKVLKISQIPVGSNITLSDNSTGIYLGKVFAVYNEIDYQQVTIGKELAVELKTESFYGYLTADSGVVLRKSLKVISYTETNTTRDELASTLKTLFEKFTYSRYDCSSISAYAIVAVMLDEVTSLKYVITDNEVSIKNVNDKIHLNVAYEVDDKLYTSVLSSYLHGNITFRLTVFEDNKKYYFNKSSTLGSGWLYSNILQTKCLLMSQEEMQHKKFKEIKIEVNGHLYEF